MALHETLAADDGEASRARDGRLCFALALRGRPGLGRGHVPRVGVGAGRTERVVVPATAALMIVGLLTVRRKEAPAMAGADRMTIEEVVRKVLLDEHADVIREAVEAVGAEMMEVEVSELIGAERGERRPRIGRRIATAIGRGAGTPGRARSSCRSPRSARAATSRASWSRAGAPSRRCWRSSSRPMCAASRRGGSTSSSRASGCGSAERGQPDLRGAG